MQTGNLGFGSYPSGLEKVSRYPGRELECFGLSLLVPAFAEASLGQLLVDSDATILRYLDRLKLISMVPRQTLAMNDPILCRQCKA